jgi:hypothetical protein
LSKPVPSPIDDNPFASRYVRPGAMPYRFDHGHDVEFILRRFDEAGRRGQIVGPHGSGKSTLLAALAAALRAKGEQTKIVELHDGCRHLPADADPPAGGVLLVDGYEQLSRISRWRLAYGVRRRQAGLIVTTHTPQRLPTLYTTAVGEDAAVQLAEQLLVRSQGPDCIRADEVRALFRAEHGNMREVFFRLYDLYESRRS